MKRKYDVAAFVWPAYTGDEPRTRIFCRITSMATDIWRRLKMSF